VFLTRARVRRDRGLAALAPVLLPGGDGARADTGHRLVWSLFGDAPDRRRDFLWREEAPGTLLLLSARPPADPGRLFELNPPKPFEPALRPGDCLAFMLRANAVVARSVDGTRSHRADVVADAMRAVPPDERAARRRTIISEVGGSWLCRQGAANGFRLAGPVAVEGDEWRRIPRPGAKPIRFNVLDFAGTLQVTEPAVFVARLCTGFGHAKAFGCGLMLIRRV
jgi:CRISPR system Cascade subunit CasE